jgi:hypothetical protein
MNANLFRCGWCGCPTQTDGKPLDGEAMKKAIKIIEKYGDGKTVKVNGWCCPNGNY